MIQGVSDESIWKTRVYDAFAPRVQAYARRHVGDAAMEVTSETFLIAWRRRRALEAEERLLPWLFGTAYLVIQNKELPETEEPCWRTAVRQMWHVEGIDGEDARREACLDALGACTDLEREVVLLAAWDGMSVDDIAMILDRPVEEIADCMDRGRARLDEAYAGDGEGQPGMSIEGER